MEGFFRADGVSDRAQLDSGCRRTPQLSGPGDCASGAALICPLPVSPACQVADWVRGPDRCSQLALADMADAGFSFVQL